MNSAHWLLSLKQNPHRLLLHHKGTATKSQLDHTRFDLCEIEKLDVEIQNIIKKMIPTRTLLAALSLLAAVQGQTCPDTNCEVCNFGAAPGGCRTCKNGFGLYGGVVGAGLAGDARCCAANLKSDTNGACTVNVCDDPNCVTCSSPDTCTTCKTGYQAEQLTGTSRIGCTAQDSDSDHISDSYEGDVLDTGR